MKKVRTRIAPSPTGYVHIGTLRTALYNYFFAKKAEGDFIIRIEDTDQKRFVEGAMENLLSVMKRMHINHDEGPVISDDGAIEEKGEFGPYIQSQRKDIYAEYADRLIEQGDAYHCFCTSERLAEMREAQKNAKQTPKYDRHCLGLSKEDVQARINAGESYVLRMQIPEGKTEFDDIIRGKIVIDNNEIDDQVIVKSDGMPVYHFAVVIDDHLMQISHIIRGEEWISSTPKHVTLYEMLGFDQPKFAHVPLLLNEDKTKLSKRQGDVSVEDFLNKGYLPDALINFVATLGYNPKGDQEIYEMDELIKLFDLSKVNKSGAVMNIEKLDWMNGEYIKKLSDEAYLEIAAEFTGEMTQVQRNAAIVEKQRIQRFDELPQLIGQYDKLPEYDANIIVWKKADAADATMQLNGLLEQIDTIPFDGQVSDIEEVVKGYISSNDLQNGNVLWPLRIALSGQERSVSPFDLLWILGKDESKSRIEIAISKLG